jgi:hypothetical protein
MGSEVPKPSFATKHLEQDLGRLLQVGVSRALCVSLHVWLTTLSVFGSPDVIVCC